MLNNSNKKTHISESPITYQHCRLVSQKTQISKSHRCAQWTVDCAGALAAYLHYGAQLLYRRGSVRVLKESVGVRTEHGGIGFSTTCVVAAPDNSHRCKAGSGRAPSVSLCGRLWESSDQRRSCRPSSWDFFFSKACMAHSSLNRSKSFIHARQNHGVNIKHRSPDLGADRLGSSVVLDEKPFRDRGERASQATSPVSTNPGGSFVKYIAETCSLGYVALWSNVRFQFSVLTKFQDSERPIHRLEHAPGLVKTCMNSVDDEPNKN